MENEITSDPYLSICIPTYNRAAFLAPCLESIVSQLPLEKPIEIWISDNASTDHTPEIAQRYTSQYPFIHYRRNEVNRGADRNFLQALHVATGKFVKLQGDDDYFKPGTLAILLGALQQNEDAALTYIELRKGDLAVHRGEGLSAYLRTTTFLAGHITAIVFRREDLSAFDLTGEIKVPYLNHIHLQYSLLGLNPRFGILNCRMFNAGPTPAETYSTGEVYIERYQAVLRHFIGKGLTLEDYEWECKETLFVHLIPNIPVFIRIGKPGHFNDFKEIYMRNYKDKPYYEEGLARINAVLPT